MTVTTPDTITSIIKTQCTLGEGAYYSPLTNSAYWVDIKGHALYQMDWATQQVHKQSFSEPVCWVVESVNGDLLVGFERSIQRVTLGNWERTLITQLNAEPRTNRLNDASVDRNGNLYFGTMDNNEVDASGSLYRLTSELTCQRVDGQYIVSNGPAVSPCGTWLYSVRSDERVIYRMRIGSDGSLSHKQAWIVFDQAMGVPDGLTVDRNGYLWIAAWDGGGVYQFSAQGIRQRFIPLPAPRITSLVFAGKNLDFLLVTSANVGLTSEQLRANPHSGNTFIVKVDAQGVSPTLAHC